MDDAERPEADALEQELPADPAVTDLEIDPATGLPLSAGKGEPDPEAPEADVQEQRTAARPGAGAPPDPAAVEASEADLLEQAHDVGPEDDEPP